MKQPEVLSKVECLRRITSLQKPCELAGGSKDYKNYFHIRTSITYK